MKQPRHSIGTAFKTASHPLAVLLALFVCVVLAGSNAARADITNTATASGTYEGDAVVSDPVTVNVPVAPAADALQVTKTATPDTNVAAGTVVTYTYRVRNNGNVTLTNITLADTHKGVLNALTPTFSTWVLNTASANTGNTIDALAPGDEAEFTATYTITQSDVDLLQ
jgi:hypothetical protein